MLRIIYLCPCDNTPVGGIKVIYRHAELLMSLGAEAFVLHPLDTAFRCTWFEHRVRFLDNLAVDARRDFVVIPEVWAGVFGPQCRQQGVRYAVFVQNGYLTHSMRPDFPLTLMNEVYRGADLVLAISDDTARMVALNYPSLDQARLLRVPYSVHERFLSTGSPAETAPACRMITFMPRKMVDHAARVVFTLRQHLPPGWQITAIHNVDEATCAAMLLASSIFLSFSEFEGLPLPPLEAALAGNLVVGYTGQGAREYWEPPNFKEVHQGNIIGFVEAAQHAVARMDAGGLERPVLQPGDRAAGGALLCRGRNDKSAADAEADRRMLW